MLRAAHAHQTPGSRLALPPARGACSRRAPPPRASSPSGAGPTSGSGGRAPFVPPGKLPFLGHLLQIDLKRIYDTTDALFQKHDVDTLELQVLSQKIVHTRNAEDCAHIYQEQSSFPKTMLLDVVSDWLGNGLATQQDIPKHAKMRRLLNPAFRTEYIKGLNPVFAEVGDQLADILLEMGEHDIQDMAMRATLDIIGQTGFRYNFGCLDMAAGKTTSPVVIRAGTEDLDVAKLFEQLAKGAGNLFAFARLFPTRDYVPGYSDYRTAIGKLDSVIDTVMEARRKEGIKPTDLDLISFCLRALEEDPSLMDDRQIRNELHTMLFAGSDTTANTLAWMFHQLAKYPDLQDRCVQEVMSLAGPVSQFSPMELNERLPFLTACFKETLRLWPPAPMTVRRAVADSVLPGSRTFVPAETILSVNIWAVHHSAQYWKRPNDWCPQRWLPEGQAEFGIVNEKAFIPFGGGPRICIGMYFALLEGQVIATQLLRKIKFDVEPTFEPKLTQAVTLTSENGIILKASARRPSPSFPSSEDGARELSAV